MFFPQRKPTRIPNYNYASYNYYFVTICTYGKKCIFGAPGNSNSFGKIAEECLRNIPNVYPQVFVDKCVVMPNHIHAILVFGRGETDQALPNLSNVIGQYKMVVTKMIHRLSPNMQIWQRSFHDHIIRNEKDYQKIWEYIDTNEIKWEEDCFYTNTKE